MDPNLWAAQTVRINDVLNTGSMNSATTLTRIAGNLDSIKANLITGKSYLTSGIGRQRMTYNIISNEEGRLNNKKQSVDDAYSSTNRMIKLNDNYQKRTWDYTKIIVVWVGVLALYLIMNLLVQYVPAIPSILTDILVLIALISAAIYSFIIYNNLQNYDKMYYGEITPKFMSLSADQATKNMRDLSNAIAGASANLPTDNKALTCIRNNLFYYKNPSGDITCYKTCTSPDNNIMGCCSTTPIGVSAINLESFINIQANGEYEFSDYTKV
jgi:hypothetical protein